MQPNERSLNGLGSIPIRGVERDMRYLLAKITVFAPLLLLDYDNVNATLEGIIFGTAEIMTEPISVLPSGRPGANHLGV